MIFSHSMKHNFENTIPSVSNKKIWHILIGGSIGNFTEWYNFLLYGYLAPVMSRIFFPTKNKLLSLTLFFSVFALSFITRPLGGIFFGWLGDTYGRQRALITSLIFMMIATVLMACLPTYNQIGIISPLLLLLLRILQGLSAGGEHTGSAIFIAEHAPDDRRTFWVTSVPVSAALGVLMSSIAALILVTFFNDDLLHTWGWRIGFLIGALLCVISILLRLRMPESPYDKEIKKEIARETKPLRILFQNKDQVKRLFITFLFASSWGIFYQTIFIWMPTFLTSIMHFTDDHALLVNSIYLLIFVILMLIVGYNADRTQRKILLRISSLSFILFSYPLFWLLTSGQLWHVYLAMTLFTVIFAMYLPIAFITMLELFVPKVRYTGFSLGFNLGLAIFGGTTPLVLTWLIRSLNSNSAPAYYVIVAGVVAFFTTFALTQRSTLKS